jgi:hypothetical protein
LTERQHHHDKATHLIVNIQRQHLAGDWVAVTVVLNRNEVGVVARHEGDGARGVSAEELGKTPLKFSSEKRQKQITIKSREV